MRVLVTGGAGFIGSHLVDYLIDRGFNQIDVLDDLSTGSLDNLSTHTRVFFHRGSAAKMDDLIPLADKADMIFHLAAVVGVDNVLKYPLAAVAQNVQMGANVLKLAAMRKIPTLITSSSEVYGDRTQVLSEDLDLRIKPDLRWGYAAAKLVDEFTARAYHVQMGLPVVICRLFNIIGPRQSGQYGMVVPRFIEQALTNADITVYGDGTQKRSFTWVGRAVEAMVKLIETPKAYGQIVNIGSWSSITIHQLALIIRYQTASSSYIRYVKRDVPDIDNRVPDLQRIHDLIRYQPASGPSIDSMISMILENRRAAHTKI